MTSGEPTWFTARLLTPLSTTFLIHGFIGLSKISLYGSMQSIRRCYLWWRPSGHLQKNNAFRQIRLSDYRQYLSSPAGYRTRRNLSDWRLHHPTRFWLWCISYKTCVSLSMQYVEARTSTNLISNFSTTVQFTYLSCRQLISYFLQNTYQEYVQPDSNTAAIMPSL